MTLREIRHYFVDQWASYQAQITTQNILDWSLVNLFITVLLGLFCFIASNAILIALAAPLESLGVAIERALSKQQGTLYSVLVIIGVCVAIFAALVAVFGVFESFNFI